MNIISIDPGIKRIGLCAVKNGSVIVETIERDFASQKDKYISIVEIIRQRCYDYHARIAVLEDYPYKIYSKTILDMAEMKALIKLGLYKSCVKLIMMPISVWKMYMPELLKGVNKKVKKYRQIASEMFEHDFKNSDEVDAYFMMKTFYAIMGGNLKSTGAGTVYDKIQEALHE